VVCVRIYYSTAYSLRNPSVGYVQLLQHNYTRISTHFSSTVNLQSGYLRLRRSIRWTVHPTDQPALDC